MKPIPEAFNLHSFYRPAGGKFPFCKKKSHSEEASEKMSRSHEHFQQAAQRSPTLKLMDQILILCIDHRFKSFPEVLYQMVSLETVLLGNNQVGAVDATRLLKLVHLSTLDLSNNDLLNIPPELGLCSSLR